MACLREPNSWGSYGARSGPRAVGAAPPSNPHDDFGRWPAVGAHRVADRSAITTEAGGAIATGKRCSFSRHGRHRAWDDLDVGDGQAMHLFEQSLARLY